MIRYTARFINQIKISVDHFLNIIVNNKILTLYLKEKFLIDESTKTCGQKLGQ